jgi:hypothetical protein
LRKKGVNVSCEDAYAKAEAAQKLWLEADAEVITLRAPLMGKMVTMTNAEVETLEDAQNRSAEAARLAIGLLKRAVKLDHRLNRM